MNCILSYSVNQTLPTKQDIETRIDEILSRYVFFRCMTSFVIIHINAQGDWDVIRKELTEVAKNSGDGFFFIMSPIIYSGRYNGWMTKAEWAEINKLSLE